MMWTRFMDMHSGGGQKLDWAYIFIEAPQAEAEVIFQNMFDRNPNRVTCTCCGNDYSIGEEESLEQATAYDRGCANVYLRPDGSEAPEGEGWVSGKGVTPGYTNVYVERVDSGNPYKKYVTLADYIARGQLKIVTAAEILPEQRKGELHEEGYVWR